MSSISRLINLAGPDPGFYILALHSYMEKYLKNDSPVMYTEYGYGDFGRNIRRPLKKRWSLFENSPRDSVVIC